MFNTDNANCLGVDPELFFPVGTMKMETEKILQRVCAKCEVFWECRDYALNVKVDGFWAGTDAKQREELRKEFNIDPIRVDEEYKIEFQNKSQSAKYSRAYRAGQKEAG